MPGRLQNPLVMLISVRKCSYYMQLFIFISVVGLHENVIIHSETMRNVDYNDGFAMKSRGRK